ncbi:MAG: DHH family phosphoesterase [Egibacteraceae bacterium]
MISDDQWARATAVLAAAREVALTCHVDPDGDALGSMLALQRVLRLRGVTTRAAWGNDAPLPKRYAFLPGAEQLTPLAEFPTSPQVLVVFDCSTLERIGDLRASAEAAGCVIVIDHHASGAPFGDVRLVDGDAAATVVLVEQLIRRMGEQLDRDVATCLYVGLITDTGRFAYASTTPEVMELGARLIAYDIDHAAINRRVWGSCSFGALKALARGLERARLMPEVGLAWTAVWQRDLVEFGITMEEAEGLLQVLHGLDGCDCTCVCKEQEPAGASVWKVTLRSDSGVVDVGRIALGLGGGGHAAAGGFTAAGSLRDVISAVVAQLAALRTPAQV